MSKEYWQERARQNKLKIIKHGENNINMLKRRMLVNLLDVKKQIKAFYDKYGEDYKQDLTVQETAKYKKKVRKAIKKYPKDKTLKKILRDDAPKYKIDRLREFETQLQIGLSEITAQQETGVHKALIDTAKLSDNLVLKTIKDGANLTFNNFGVKKLEKICNQNWIGGVNWSARIWKNREKLGRKLTTILSKGLPQGQSLQKMSRELAKTLNQSYNDSFRLIRTESSHIDTQVTIDRYKSIQDELGEKLKYRFDAFLDNRTSKICKELNNKTFWLDDAVVGENLPPMHPNCRSTINLLMDLEEKEEEKEENSVLNDLEKNYGKDAVKDVLNAFKEEEFISELKESTAVYDINKPEDALKYSMFGSEKDESLRGYKLALHSAEYYGYGEDEIKRNSPRLIAEVVKWWLADKDSLLKENEKFYNKAINFSPVEEFAKRQRKLKPYKKY